MEKRSILLIALSWFCHSTTTFHTFVTADDASDEMRVLFVNQFSNTFIDLYWENKRVPRDHPQRRRLEAKIPPQGGYFAANTFLGHEFSYDFNGKRHYINPPPPNAMGEQFLVIAGDTEGFRVRCEVTTNSRQATDDIDIIVKPYWAPRAASRFLELVRGKYYDGVAFNRVVPNFLTQFGIARDYETRTRERQMTIWDDFPTGIRFEPGFLSFAGNGPDSRTTEVFIVMPGASEEQLNRFGENIWEAPFGVVDGDVNESALTRIYSGYGDMPPWGNGPDSSQIYDINGYSTYISENFPKLDYINRCYVVEETNLTGDYSEGEF